MKLPNLDIELLRTFTAIAKTENFTTAGEIIGASQSAISVRINKLEERLGEKLMSRTPQSVRLTAFGKDFLTDAYQILELHDEIALRLIETTKQKRICLGVSDHVIGPHLARVIATLQNEIDNIQFIVTVETSSELSEGFKKGKFDIVLTREDLTTPTGRKLFKDKLVWTSANNFSWDNTSPLPLISLASECSIRNTATRTLTTNNIHWKEVFLGSGIAAVQSAISMGLGISCLESRNVPKDCIILKPGKLLPKLPATEIKVLYRKELITEELIKKLISAFRSEKTLNLE